MYSAFADNVGHVLAIACVLAATFIGAQRGGTMGVIALGGGVILHATIAALSWTEIAFPPTADNLSFHTRAQEYVMGYRAADFSLPSSFAWSYGLSIIYNVIGSSLWLAYTINLWIFFLMLLQVGKFCDEIGLNEVKWGAVAATALVPSSLLFVNLLLREPFQMLLLVLMVRSANSYRVSGKIFSLVKLTGAFIPFAVIHGAFFLFGPILLAITVFGRIMLSPGRASSLGKMAAAVLGGLLIVGALSVVSVVGSTSRVGDALEGQLDIADAMASSAERGARTVLPWAPAEGVIGAIIGAPMLLVQFLGAPVVPFMVRTPSDFVATVDVALRMLILVGIIILRHRCGKEARRTIDFLVIIYLSFCLLAAMGTSTVGTALRHQVKVLWVVAPLGLAGIAQIGRKRRRS